MDKMCRYRGEAELVKEEVLLSALLAVFIPLLIPVVQSVGDDQILLLKLEGYISPSSAEYIEQSLVDSSRYRAVIITINTFGGLGDPMFRIIDAIQNSESPVIVYVYPPGGQALSAGTYILMSSSLAAMAPHTLIGSAQPVVNGVPSNETKLINFLVAKMQDMAELHGRNATQAARFITHNDNLGPEEALRLGVVEVIAEDIGELIEKADGRKVRTLRGEYVLRLKGAEIVELGPDARIQLLSIISDPLVSGILLSLGFLVLIFGLSSPGMGAEIIGGVLIILGLVGQGFNINWAGLALIALGSVFMLYEFYTGGTGLAIAGGIILLAIGLVLLVRAPPGSIFVSQAWLTELMVSISIVAVFTAAVLAFILYKGLRASIRGSTYPLAPRASIGRATETIKRGEIGYVVIGGEYRKALALSDITVDQYVKIVGEKDNLLIVEPVDGPNSLAEAT